MSRIGKLLLTLMDAPSGDGGEEPIEYGELYRAMSCFNRVPTNFVSASGNPRRVANYTSRSLSANAATKLRIRLDNVVFKVDGTVGGYGNSIEVVNCFVRINNITRRVTFDGENTRVIADGEYEVLSDEILPSNFSLSVFAALQGCEIRIEVECPTDGRIPILDGEDIGYTPGFAYYPHQTTCTNLNTSGTLTFSGTAPSATFGLAPILVGVYETGDPPTYMYSGDSIAAQGNRQSYCMETGRIVPRVGALQVGRGGGNHAVNIQYPEIVASFLKYCNVVVDEYGTNMVASTELAALQTQALQAWTWLRDNEYLHPDRTPLRIVRPELLIITTGTFSTTGGQTVAAGWGSGEKVELLNAWYHSQEGVDDGPDVVVNITDGVGGTVRGSTTPGETDYYKWKASMTSDGTHPNAACATILANNLRPAMPT